MLLGKVRWLVGTVVATAALVLGTATNLPEVRVVERVNEVRDRHGLQLLRPGHRLTVYAERHARRMARAGSLFHSDLSFPKPRGWRVAGENVAQVRALGQAVREWMHSPDHRENILRPEFARTGVGAVRRGEWWYVVQVFVG